MPSKMYEIAFQLGAKLQSNFNASFNAASKNIKNLETQSKTANKGFLGLGEVGTKVFKAAAGAVAGIGFAEAAKQSIELASSLNEVQNVVDVTFGQSSKQIDAWSKTALNSFGLSELQAKQYTGTLGAMFKSSGITGKALVGMSENLVGLSGDISSFYNLPIDEAMEKIRAGISGETMPLKQLGINMDVANLSAFALSKGIKKSYQSMSQAEQTQLRYNYLMSVTKDAQGDFARTQTSFANQVRIAKTNLAQMGASIGNLVLPFLNKLLIGFNNFMKSVPKIQEYMKNLFASTGITKGFNNIMSFISKGTANFGSFGKAISKYIPTFKGLGLKIGGSFVSMLPSLQKMFTTLSGTFKKLSPTLQSIVSFVVKNILPQFSQAFNFIATNVVPKLAAVFAKWMPKIADFINNLWIVAQPILKLFILWIKILAAEAFVRISGILKIVGDVASGIFSILDGIIRFIAGVFTGNWSKAWSGVREVFSGIFSTLGAILKAPLNAVIILINEALAGINQINFKVPDWIPGIGGKQFGVHIPSIPMLANGGYVKHRPGGILANIGEGKEDEVVSPVSKLKNIINNTNTQQPVFTYAPKVNIYGNASKNDVYQALSMSQADFNRMADNYFRSKQRLSLNEK